MQLSRYSVDLHATRQGTLGHSRLSSLSHCGLILAQRVELVFVSQSPVQKKKKVQAGNEWSNLLPKIFASEEKATIPPTIVLDTGSGLFEVVIGLSW